MSQRTPTRLDLHRLKYRWNGGRAELIQYFKLDPAEKRLIAEDVFTRVYVSGGQRDPYDVYAEVFSDWGVVCPHPQHKRAYSGTVPSEYPLPGHRWYRCDCCGASCVNEDRDGDTLFRKVG